MHPHRRAQLELEQPRQAGHGSFTQKSPNELAAAAAIKAGRAAATHQGAISETKNHAQDTADPGKAIKAATKQRKYLRAQIKQANENYSLTHQYVDELKAINDDAKLARWRQRSARLEQRKVDRAELKAQAMANGTYETKRKRRLERMSKIDLRGCQDRTWDAEQAEKTELRGERGAGSVNADATRHPFEYRSQHPSHYHRYREWQLGHDRFDQELQLSQIAAHQQNEDKTHADYHTVEQEFAESERWPDRFHDYQEQRPAQALFDQEQRLNPFTALQEDEHAIQVDYRSEGGQSTWNEQLGTRSYRPLGSLDVNSDRMTINGKSSGLSSSGNDEEIRMGHDCVPLNKGGAQEREWKTIQLPLRNKVADFQVSGYNTAFAPPEECDTGNTNLKSVPVLATEPIEKQIQSARPMYGDGSKGFLDPSSIAYRMMSRMGWSQGRGLGKDGSGPQDFIKVDLKRDRKGVRETQALATGRQEGIARNYAAPFKGSENPHSLAHHPQQIGGGNAIGYYQNLRWTSNNIHTMHDRPQAGVNIAAHEENKHHQVTRSRIDTIDLTQDDSKARKGGQKSGGAIYIDLTQDLDNDDCMVMDSTASWDVSREKRSLAYDDQRVPTALQAQTMPANVADDNLELQLDAAQGAQMDLVRDSMENERPDQGDQGLQQRDGGRQGQLSFSLLLATRKIDQKSGR